MATTVTDFVRGATVALAVTALLQAPTARAHEHKKVGNYEFTFGGTEEPVITGERMWLEIRVEDRHAGKPVTGLEKILKMKISGGGRSMALKLKRVHGRPGRYKAAVLFTKAGTYRIEVSGKVSGMPVNLSFEKPVDDRTALRFPR